MVFWWSATKWLDFCLNSSRKQGIHQHGLISQTSLGTRFPKLFPTMIKTQNSIVQVLAVPHSFELADVQWHLVALICLEHPFDPKSCSSVTCGLQSMPPLRRVAFLHGQNSKEWLVEEGALLELRTGHHMFSWPKKSGASVLKWGSQRHGFQY